MRDMQPCLGFAGGWHVRSGYERFVLPREPPPGLLRWQKALPQVAARNHAQMSSADERTRSARLVSAKTPALRWSIRRWNARRFSLSIAQDEMPRQLATPVHPAHTTKPNLR